MSNSREMRRISVVPYYRCNSSSLNVSGKNQKWVKWKDQMMQNNAVLPLQAFIVKEWSI